MTEDKTMLEIRSFQQPDAEQVVDLWRRCGLVTETNDPRSDIRRKLRVNPEWFLVGLVGDQLVATCMAGYEGHRGWVNYLAVAPRHRRKGYAGRLMEEAEKRLKAAGCPKINLQVRETNLDVIQFYQSIGFATDRVVSLGKRLIKDNE
jgi:ribosomal protein S18 acetylase RimI-like enzyme